MSNSTIYKCCVLLCPGNGAGHETYNGKYISKIPFLNGVYEIEEAIGNNQEVLEHQKSVRGEKHETVKIFTENLNQV